MTNIHACLVHERPECVSDLVANLRYLDPESIVLLYDGSPGRQLLDAHLGAKLDGLIVHPNPRPMRWGRLHDFALDSLRLALTLPDFTTLTVVDSDQLASRPGYSAFLSPRLSEDTGCLVSPDGGYQPRATRSSVARAAWGERALWRPLLEQFSDGDDLFPQWTFWPSTVITRAAASEVLCLAELPCVVEILNRTRLWATEEILLPTLVALAGHRVDTNPCSSDYVRYRIRYTLRDMQRALRRSDVFWLHPVARRYGDPNRRYVRDRYGGYTGPQAIAGGAEIQADPPPSGHPVHSLQPALPLLDRMGSVHGVLTRAEGDLLLAATKHALAVVPPPHKIELIGLTCRRARFVVDAAIESENPNTTVSEFDSESEARRRDAAALVFVAPGVGFAAGVEAFRAAEKRLADGGLVAWRNRTSAGPDVDLIETLVTLGVASRQGEADSLSVLQQVRRLNLPLLSATLDQSARIDGWLTRDEAALLALAVVGTGPLPPGVIVEVGSYSGRATVVLAAVAKLVKRSVVAIDRFDGVVGEIGALHRGEPTLGGFRSAIAAAGVENVVEIIQGSTETVDWAGRPVTFVLVDGLHDYASVSRDFHAFANDVVEGGFVAFHDYAPYYPGVQSLVRELKATTDWRLVVVVGTLALFQRVARRDTRISVQPRPAEASMRPAELSIRPPRAAAPDPAHSQRERPLVSCIMPTYNRPEFVEAAIRYFLRQDYPRKELVIVDDGDDYVEHLVPDDDRFHYLRTSGRGSIGGKRNLACDLASGELIAHWDDDDWYAPCRLSRQVDALLTGDADVVGDNQLLYWAPASGQAWRYAYPAAGRPWLHDPTLCYLKSLWSAQSFPPTNHALDCGWLWRGPRKRLRSLNSDPVYVGIIHATNTSLKITHDPRWTYATIDDLTRVVGADFDRYQAGAAR